MSAYRVLFAAALSLLCLTPARPAAPPGNLDRHGDALPPGAVARFGSLRFRVPHDAEEVVKLSEDGGHVVFAKVPQVLVYTKVRPAFIYRMDTTSGRLVRSLQIPEVSFPTKPVLAFTPAADRVAITSDDHLTLFDVATGKRLWRIDKPNADRLTFDPAGKLLAAFTDGGEAPRVRIYRADSGKELSSLRLPHPHHIRLGSLALTPDGSRLLSRATVFVTERKTYRVLRLWNVDTGRVLREVRDEFGEAAFRPDSKEVAVAVGGPSLELWDAVTGKTLRRLRASGDVGLLRYSPRGDLLAAVTGKGRVDVWETATGKGWPVRLGPDASVDSLAFPEKGRVVALSHEYRSWSVVLWDVRTGKVLACPAGHRGKVTSLRFAGPDRLMTTSFDGQILTWDLAGRELARTKPRPQRGDGGKLMFLHFSPGGRWVAGYVEDGDVHAVHDLTSGKRVFGEKRPGYQFEDTETSFSRDDSILVSADKEEDEERYRLRPVRVDSGEKLPVIDLGKEGLNARAVSPDGRLIAALCSDYSNESAAFRMTYRLFSTATGKPVAGYRPFTHERGNYDWLLLFTPDGRHLLGAGRDDRKLFLLDARTGGVAHTFRLPKSFSHPVVFCTAGRMVALTHWDGQGLQSIAVYELRTGRKRLEFTPREQVTALAFSPDGRRLASGHENGTALLWDLDTGGGADSSSLERLWTDLADTDAGRAYRAMLALKRRPAQAVRLAHTHVRPAAAKAPGAAELRRLIRHLDDEEYSTRQRAQAMLTEHMEEAIPPLIEALQSKPSLEAHRRIRRLLASLPPLYPPELVRSLRTVELLERIGTAEAKKALAELAGGYSGSILTREAKAALARLAKAGGSPAR